ncbi:hypothetical protein EV182_004984 [Spiromyces aspiralis]|uniref:Uncharacterized protein n=1 Tax=Spiromyces aspiralis TaxID=68401 RepID=A0ACC1HUI9_9FUNG|nr:hypothetical protein EV182_004984 [Spiromyces aspiralis]
MDFKTSGYEAVVKEYENYDIPVLLTEYGCNNPRPRTFPEIKSIYDSDMTGTFSGGFMYMYSEEANGYGIADVSYGKPGYEKTEDFDNFKDALAAVDPKGVSERDYKPSAKPSACPNKSGTWPFEADAALPPTPKEGDRSQYTKGGVAKSINGSDDSDDEASPDSSESSAARGLLGASSSVVALVAAALAHLI